MSTHRFEIIRGVSIEKAHRPHFDDRHGSASDAAELVLDYPEMTPDVVKVAEHILREAAAAQPESAHESDAAPVSGMIAAAPTVRLEMPIEARDQYELAG